MKKIVFGILCLSLVCQAAFADCRAQYLSQKKEGLVQPVAIIAENAPVLAIGMTPFALAASGIAGTTAALTVLFVPSTILVAGVGAYESYVLVSNIKENKMIKLINQSEAYSQNPAGIPGKVLRKLHKKINRPELSMKDLATFITDRNYDLSLCSSNESYKDIKRGLSHANVRDVTID